MHDLRLEEAVNTDPLEEIERCLPRLLVQVYNMVFRVSRHAVIIAAGSSHPVSSREVKLSPPGNLAKASQKLGEPITWDNFRCPRKGGDVRGAGGEVPGYERTIYRDRMLRSSSDGKLLMNHSN